MADARGFLTTPRETPARRPVDLRLTDWREVYEPLPADRVRAQAGRCMDCGIPFCHAGCPLGNLIPDWNDLVRRDDWRSAITRLHATNNFPEFTGRLCPAPCEASCVLSINADPVTIKQIEVEIVDRAWAEGWVAAEPPGRLTGRTVAVVGSGPAGLAAAQQLTRAGHTVAVYERDDRPGGLLRYGIPEFKMERRYLDRRIEQMQAEGTRFRTAIEVGTDVTGHELRSRYDAVLLAVGATAQRELPIAGRELDGIHQAMTYLTQSDRVRHGDVDAPPIDARAKHVVIIGGGDTGADCLGTAHRQGAASVTHLDIRARPPEEHSESTPWPTWPLVLRTTPAHEEGGDRVFGASSRGFVDDGSGHVAGIRLLDARVITDERGRRLRYEAVPHTEREHPADLVLLALGFTGPEQSPLAAELGLSYDGDGTFARTDAYETSTPGVYVAGDAGRGQSLIVWAIAEGRAAAAAIDGYLTGSTDLPSPVRASDRPIG